MSDAGKADKLADVSAHLSAANEKDLLAACREALDAGASHEDVLAALIPPAARALQLKYPTPHGLIALTWTLETLPWLGDDERTTVTEACARYIGGCPNLNLSFEEPPAPGTPYVDDPAEGLDRSLREHRVYDAVFYGLRLFEDGPPADAARRILGYAANEVHGLGHVFIYTACALRLLGRCDAAQRPHVLAALAEFLSRRAEFDEPSHLSDERPLEGLVAGAFERINILGHNAIFAAELRRALDEFPQPIREHLRGQLARNIGDSDETLSRAAYRAAVSSLPPGDAPLDALVGAFEAGDTPAALNALAAAWEHPPARRDLRNRLVVLFARIDTAQSHYLIYPPATFRLLDLVGDRDAELGVAQLVKMGAEAAGKFGLRPA
ncbi:MAG: hypothetical protein R6V58_14425 [Planctomycetota bacterium]